MQGLGRAASGTAPRPWAPTTPPDEACWDCAIQRPTLCALPWPAQAEAEASQKQAALERVTAELPLIKHQMVQVLAAHGRNPVASAGVQTEPAAEVRGRAVSPV